MSKTKNPDITPDPRHPLTEAHTFQLGRARWGATSKETTGWVSLGAAATAARMNGGEIFTGYFDPRSATVKRS